MILKNSRYFGDLGAVRVDLDRILQDRFGIAKFREPQKEIIEQILAGQNTLAVMPTGYGKSLCYQLPSSILDGLTLVISPLIALAEDQVRGAEKRNLKATFINSSLRREQREQRLAELAAGELKLLYVTPERLKSSEFLAALGKQKIALLAVDEAHCLSQWGHDFRPEYSRLGEHRQRLGNPVTLALTATATPQVQKEIQSVLSIDPAQTRVIPVDRPNLFLAVTEVYGIDEKIQRLVMAKHQHTGAMIVYFSLISTLEKVSLELQRMNIEHVTYHGQMGDTARRENQSRFMSGESEMILATPAFGLGIDKADVRSVFHAEIPGSIEAYYQEAGRAGRDGQPAHCEVWYDNDDATIQMDFIKWTNPESEFIRSVFRLIQKNLGRVRQEGSEYLRNQMLFYHSRDYRLETALNLLERWGAISWPNHDFRKIEILAEPEGDWLDQELVERRLKGQNQKLLQWLQWLSSNECRKLQIYNYFGQVTNTPCGNCDRCL